MFWDIDNQRYTESRDAKFDEDVFPLLSDRYEIDRLPAKSAAAPRAPEQEYLLEAVTGERKARGGTEYCCEWLGWEKEESTWEKLHVIEDCEPYKVYKRKKEQELRDEDDGDGCDTDPDMPHLADADPETDSEEETGDSASNGAHQAPIGSRYVARTSRSGRTPKPTERLSYAAILEGQDESDATARFRRFRDEHAQAAAAAPSAPEADHVKEEYEPYRQDPNPASYSDILKLHPDDIALWDAAIKKEHDALVSKGAFKVIKRSDLKKGTELVTSKLDYRNKRCGTKKARCCARGFRQEKRESDYAPVVHASTVRLFSVLAVAMGWEIKTIDIDNAYVQSDNDNPIAMTVPPEFERFGYDLQDDLLLLIKALYGLRGSGGTFNRLLVKALQKLKFTQSVLDPCLWCSPYDLPFFVAYHVDDLITVPLVSRAVTRSLPRH